MARTYKNGMGVEIQKEQIPWQEIKRGMVLMNYGHVYHLMVLFVHDISKNEMNTDYLSIAEMGDVFIHKNRIITRETWEKWANQESYNNANTTTYDEYRTNHLRDIIEQTFTTGIDLRIQ